jgi:hypothetical protein
MAQDEVILVDGDGVPVGTSSNPMYCQVASPEEA